jgi:hypothetical protein
MAAKPRKKWATRVNDLAAQLTRHTSETKAFQRTQELADHLGPAAKGLTVDVLVDEGMGRGWELYERLSLPDLNPA